MSDIKKTVQKPVVVEGEILPSTEIDCSSWAPKIPAELWAHAPAAKVESEDLAFTEIDGSDWGFVPPPAMIVHLQFAPASDPCRCSVALLQFKSVIDGVDRDLGGAGFELQSNRADNGTLKLVFGPVNPAGADARIEQIVTALNEGGLMHRPAEVISWCAKRSA